MKQHLAAIRMLFDWLVIGQIVPSNPTSSARGPNHVVRQGKTLVFTTDEAVQLIDAIDASRIAGLWDRVLIGVGAVVKMNAEDYYPQGKCFWLRLHGSHYWIR